jgi:enamine deaminase RidA (YjgF/YER057c/UK114 family)
VRTRIYMTDADHWAEVARAHREALGDVRPAATIVEVSRLLDPRLLVEIEATAYQEGGG